MSVGRGILDKILGALPLCPYLVMSVWGLVWRFEPNNYESLILGRYARSAWKTFGMTIKLLDVPFFGEPDRWLQDCRHA
jgi:hypothetical protein